MASVVINVNIRGRGQRLNLLRKVLQIVQFFLIGRKWHCITYHRLTLKPSYFFDGYNKSCPK